MTRKENIQQMTAEQLAEFLLVIAETGTQYISDRFCEMCCDPDCPDGNGCRYSMMQIATQWLQSKAE